MKEFIEKLIGRFLGECVMYRFGLVMCIITAVITIIGLVKHKKSITIRAIIGFVLSVVYTIIFYNRL